MAEFNDACDSRSGQLPLKERVATFIDSLQEDAVSTSRSNTEHGSSGSEHNDHPQHQEAVPMVEVSTPMETASEQQPQIPAQASRRGRQTPNRRRRYRDERQKLSNSMAQKRYRERKKLAFEHMKTMVDNLTAEVGRLQHLKRENDKLTLEMEEYRSLAEVHGINRLQQPANAHLTATASKPSLNAALSAPVTALPLLCATNLQMPLADGSGQPLFSLQNLHTTDWAGTLNHICQCRGPSPVDPSLNPSERVDYYEKDWNDRMTAVEHVLTMYQMCGAANSPAAEQSLPTMRACMTNLIEMNANLASMKLQKVSHDTQINSGRIQKAFMFLSNDLK